MNKLIAIMVPLMSGLHTASAQAHEILTFHSHGVEYYLTITIALAVATLTLPVVHKFYARLREK